MPRHTSQDLRCQCPVPQGPQLTHACGDPQNPIAKFVSLLWVAAFPWALVHTSFVCALKSGLGFPQSCGSPLIKSHWPSGDALGIPQPLPDPQAGKPGCGAEPSQQCENFLVLLLSSVCGLPTPTCLGFCFGRDCSPPTILLQFSLCPWILGIFFWWVLGSPLVDSCPTVVILVLSEDDEHRSFLLYHLKPVSARIFHLQISVIHQVEE